MNKLDLIEKIKSFRNLKKNWDSYGANPPSEKTILRAIWLVKCLPGDELPDLEVIPVDEAIAFDNGNLSIRVWEENKSI